MTGTPKLRTKRTGLACDTTKLYVRIGSQHHPRPSGNRAKRILFVSRGRFWARRWTRAAARRSVVVVPWLPSRTSFSVGRVGEELAVDGVADPSLQRSQCFLACLAFGLFAEVVR